MSSSQHCSPVMRTQPECEKPPTSFILKKSSVGRSSSRRRLTPHFLSWRSQGWERQRGTRHRRGDDGVDTDPGITGIDPAATALATPPGGSTTDGSEIDSSIEKLRTWTRGKGGQHVQVSETWKKVFNFWYYCNLKFSIVDC